MASVYITYPRSLHERESPPAVRAVAAPDQGLPIGSAPAATLTSARRVERNASGTLVFAQELPIVVAWKYRLVELSDDSRGFWRVEVKVRARETARPAPGDNLVMAEHPYANGWVETAGFKRGSKKGPDERPMYSARTENFEEVLAALTTLPYDPWEKGDYLTASIPAPRGQVLLGATARSYGQRTLWLFGTCDDFAAHVDELLRSSEIARLLELTQQNRLRALAPGGPKTVRSLAIHPRVAEDASTVMMLAVRQALAGPNEPLDGSAAPRAGRPQTDGWTGRPVFELVERIYRDHLYNRTRTLLRKERRHVSYEE